jgi:hypothetical protein
MLNKALFTFLILIISPSFLKAQEYEIIKKVDSIPAIKEKGLTFIDTDIDLPELYFIARIKVSGDDTNTMLLQTLKSANDLSANAFKLVSGTADQKTAIIDLFSSGEKTIEKILGNREKNVIYFLADDNKEDTFKIDGEKIKLKPKEIFKYRIPHERAVKISKGGLMGSSIMVSWKKEQSPLFFALGGYGLSPTSSVDYTQINFNINTRKIHPIKGEFVLFLTKLDELN